MKGLRNAVLTAYLLVGIGFWISGCGQSEPSTDNSSSSNSSSDVSAQSADIPMAEDTAEPDATAEPEPTPEPQMVTVWYVKYQDDTGWVSERLTPDINCEIKDSSLVTITYPDGRKKYIGGSFVITTKEEVVAQ
jgi:cytoskeletal protein RodZ